MYAKLDRLDARPLPSSGFRFPKSGLRVPGFGKMRTPEFRRIGNSPEPRDGGQAPGVLHHIMNQSGVMEFVPPRSDTFWKWTR